MKGLASYFGESREVWGLCGLLHDIDYERTGGNPNLHSKEGSEMLKELGLTQDIYEAVLTHNEAHGVPPADLMAKALFCVDPLTGLIVAAALVLPSKKLTDLTVESVLKKFKKKEFARGCDREIIAKCKEYLSLDLEEFIKIVLSSMQGIATELGF